jgi:hypothetical protein
MESEEYYITRLKDNSLYRDGKYCNYTHLDLPSKFQTMDFYLHAVREGVSLFKLPLCYEIVFEAIKYGMSLEFVNEYMIDENMSLQYISSYHQPNLNFIPSKFITEDFLLKAISLNSEIMKEIPKHMLTQKLYIRASELNGSLLRMIPKEFKTKEVCLNSIHAPGWDDKYIKDIPSEKKTMIVCESFMEKSKNVTLAVNHIPFQLKTFELLKKYVSKDGNIVLKFPKKLWNQEIWKLGVQSFVTRKIAPSKEFVEHCPDILLVPIRVLIQEKEEKEKFKQKLTLLFSSEVNEQNYFPKAGVEFREVEHEDPITMDPLQEGKIYAFYRVGEKKFLAGSLSMFKTFIVMKSHNCSLENIFVPLLNKNVPSIELEWVVW